MSPNQRDDDDRPQYGEGFSSSDVGHSTSNDGYEFDWYIAGYKPIHGEREDLEKQPDRVLTDRELASADYVVVYFSGGAGYKTFTSGPWDDWDELWHDLGDFYDVYP